MSVKHWGLLALALSVAGCEQAEEGAHGEAQVVVQALLDDEGAHVVYDLTLSRVRANDASEYEPIVLREGVASNRGAHGLAAALPCAGSPGGRAHQLTVRAKVLDAAGNAVAEAQGTQAFLCFARRTTPVRLDLQVLGGGRAGVADVRVGVDERDVEASLAADPDGDGLAVSATIAVGAGPDGLFPDAFRLVGGSNCQLEATEAAVADPFLENRPLELRTSHYACPGAAFHDEAGTFSATQGQRGFEPDAIVVGFDVDAAAGRARTILGSCVVSFRDLGLDANVTGAVVDAWALVPGAGPNGGPVPALGVRLYAAVDAEPDAPAQAKARTYLARRILQAPNGEIIGPEIVSVVGVGAVDQGDRGFLLLLATLDADTVQVQLGEGAQGIRIVDTTTDSVMIQDDGLRGWLPTGIIVQGGKTALVPRVPTGDRLYAVRCGAPGADFGCETEDAEGLFLRLTDVDSALREP
jgi:hypothetical protein